MKHKKHNSITITGLKRTLIAFATHKLTVKEKKAIKFFLDRKINKNATQTAKDLASSLPCAQSTAWAVLKSLNKLRLTKSKKSSNLEISEYGHILGDRI